MPNPPPKSDPAAAPLPRRRFAQGADPQTGPDPEQLFELARLFLQSVPQAGELGLRVDSAEPGHIGMSMPWAEKLVGDPATGVIHGGAVFTLMDTCGGAAALSHPQAGRGTATLDLRIDYMRPATPGQTIRARAECHHMTRSVAFVRAMALDDDDDRPVAIATGAFTMDRGR